jgi:multicomponent Na+:H+ antiporter subunit C
MESILAIVIGVLFAAGFYLMLRRSLVKLILGLALIGHGANLLIFTVGRLTRGEPALIAENATALKGDYADPLPQALVLTAIVIGFGLQAFAVVLMKRAYRIVNVDDLDEMDSTDQA